MADGPMAEGMPRPLRSRLDPYGRITISAGYRHILDGPVEQRETEEGILLRPLYPQEPPKTR